MSYQQPGPASRPPAPQWGAPQWGAPAPQPPKKSKAVPIVIGVAAFIVVIAIIGAVAGNKSDDGTKGAAAATTQPAAPAAATAASKAPQPTKAAPKPKPAPKTVLTESGHGIKTTAKFTVHGDWDLHYTYDCASFGFKGNFMVTSDGGDFPAFLANELGMKGADVTHQHDGGTFYLDVDSECAWTLKVVDIP